MVSLLFQFTFRHQLEVAVMTSDYDYSCGADLLLTASSLKLAIRPNLTCSTPIEAQYYKEGVGQLDICSFCGEVCIG